MSEVQKTGEKAVRTVLHQLIAEIDIKCDKVVKTVKKLDASQLEEDIRRNFSGSDNENTSQTLGFFSNVTVIYSDPKECLSIMRNKSDSFNQANQALSTLAEFCLPSILDALFDWLKEQNDDRNDSRLNNLARRRAETVSKVYMQHTQTKAKLANFTIGTSNRNRFGDRERDESNMPDTKQTMQHTQVVRRHQTINYYFAVILIEVLKQIKKHPIPDQYLKKILSTCFRFFEDQEDHMTAGDFLISEISGTEKSGNLLSIGKGF